MKYKAKIYFQAIEDDYEQGEQGSVDNQWEQTIEADTASELRNEVLAATYSKWEDLDDEQANEYDWCTEYHTSYMANALNEGDASNDEVEQWKLGKCRLWVVDCHILVTKVTETKASL